MYIACVREPKVTKGLTILLAPRYQSHLKYIRKFSIAEQNIQPPLFEDGCKDASFL